MPASLILSRYPFVLAEPVIFRHECVMPISIRQFVSSTFALVLFGIIAICALIGSSIWLSERAQNLSEAVFKARDVKALPT